MELPNATQLHQMSFDEGLNLVQRVSAEVFGKRYVYDLQTGPATDDTVRWLIRHPDYLIPSANGYVKDHYKAIMWRGTVGAGKSHLARCLFHLLPTKSGNAKMFVRCQTVVDEFIAKGEAILGRYNTIPVLFLDDLGDEDEAKRYGNERDVIGRIIDARAHHAQRSPMLTFSTTNNAKEPLRARYGDRTMDRLGEQSCVLIMKREQSFRETERAAPWSWEHPAFSR